MTITSRRARPLDRSIPHRRDTRLVIIATEGTETEQQYFTIFSERSTRVQIRVLGTEEGHSAPNHVLRRLRQFRRDYELARDDALCLVIDKDRWPDAQLATVASQASRLGFLLAVSKPCFELWLYLHHAEAPQDLADCSSAQMKTALGALLGGYDSSNIRPDRFEPHVQTAVDRAVALDVSPAARWPNSLGTRVYRVIRAIEERA